LWRYAAFCGVLRRIDAICGVLWRFVVFCSELRCMRRIVAFCSKLLQIAAFRGELWRFAVNWPSQCRLSDAAVSPGAMSVSDMTPSLHLIQQIEHLTIENGKLAQR